MQIRGHFDRHISSKVPFFSGHSCECKSTALCNDLPFLFDVYSLILLSSELLPQLIFMLSPHIDGTESKMLCKFEEIFIVTFRANYPFFLGTAADAKAQPLVMTHPSNPTCTH